MTGAPAETVRPAVRAAVCCETGLRRRSNEDNFYLDGASKSLEEMNRPVLWQQERPLGAALYGVSDGLGGVAGGELAATLAVTALGAVAPRLLARPEDQTLASACLCEISRQARLQASRLGNTMGATLVMALVHPGGLELYNLGDSRGYLLQNGVLRQLSRDHTTAQAFRDMGLPPPPPGHNGLTQYLGMDEEEGSPDPHHVHAPFPSGARLLLCSDGLTGMVEDARIAQLLQSAPTPAQAVRDLTDAALAAGGRDNITALVVERL